MKIRIAARPGELEERADDVIRVIRRLAADELKKAEPHPNRQIKQTDQLFEYAVMQESVKRSKQHVDRIRKLMRERFAEVLGT